MKSCESKISAPCRANQAKMIVVAQVELCARRGQHTKVSHCDVMLIEQNAFPNRLGKEKHAITARDGLDCTIRQGWRKTQEDAACYC
jgi:hypothetical protein